MSYIIPFAYFFKGRGKKRNIVGVKGNDEGAEGKKIPMKPYL
jgi:hypothetical protein